MSAFWRLDIWGGGFDGPGVPSYAKGLLRRVNKGSAQACPAWDWLGRKVSAKRNIFGGRIGNGVSVCE